MKCHNCIYCKEIKGSYAWCKKAGTNKQISKQDTCTKYKGADLCLSDPTKKQTP